jgi:site-specific DNA recombinase
MDMVSSGVLLRYMTLSRYTMDMTPYFLYARKSTEDEERQVMSIEAQLAELAEYAKREHIKIVETFIESKSAKSPGREVFGQLMQKIQESKEPVGIIAWHPDRLARNSIDGGQIIYLIDTSKIASLKFPTFWFEPTPQGLFMLQVAFGQSKYYSDNLSENVKRGIRQKLRRGEWPTKAPIGYINNPKTRNIEPDPMKARVIKKVFEEYGEGKHTLKTLATRLQFLGVVSSTGNPVPKATLQRMLTNEAYLGIIRHDGESYVGKFPAIVSEATFKKVQEAMKNRAKPRHSKKRHYFPFMGLLTCGECGAAITAQYAKGNGGIYKYYRCTKRLGSCSQKYLMENLLARQLREKILQVAIPEDWRGQMLAQMDAWENEGVQSSENFARNLDFQLKETDQKLDKLVNAFLDGSIEKEIYLAKKDDLIRAKVSLSKQKDDCGQKGNYWIEPMREWILSATGAAKLASSENYDDLKSFAGKIGTNRRLRDREIFWDWKDEWKLTADLLLRLPLVRKDGERSERVDFEKVDALPTMSQLMSAVRTYFTENPRP